MLHKVGPQKRGPLTLENYSWVAPGEERDRRPPPDVLLPGVGLCIVPYWVGEDHSQENPKPEIRNPKP